MVDNGLGEGVCVYVCVHVCVGGGGGGHCALDRHTHILLWSKTVLYLH